MNDHMEALVNWLQGLRDRWLDWRYRRQVRRRSRQGSRLARPKIRAAKAVCSYCGKAIRTKTSVCLFHKGTLCPECVVIFQSQEQGQGDWRQRRWKKRIEKRPKIEKDETKFL